MKYSRNWMAQTSIRQVVKRETGGDGPGVLAERQAKSILFYCPITTHASTLHLILIWMIYPGYEEKREQVLKKLDELEEESKEIMQIIQNPVVVQQLKQDKMANIQFLKENFNVRFKWGGGEGGTLKRGVYLLFLATPGNAVNLVSKRNVPIPGRKLQWLCRNAIPLSNFGKREGRDRSAKEWTFNQQLIS